MQGCNEWREWTHDWVRVQNSTDVINKKVLHKPEYVSCFTFFRAAPFCFDDNTTSTPVASCLSASPGPSRGTVIQEFSKRCWALVSTLALPLIPNCVNKSEIIKHIPVYFTHFFFLSATSFHMCSFIMFGVHLTVRKIIKWRKYIEGEGVLYTFDLYCTSNHVCKYVHVWV